jgi:hypothetical protein
VALKILCEGKIMKRYLLMAALALVTVWATGCIVVDAEKVQSVKPATIRSDECVIRQSGPAVPLRVEADTSEALDTADE